MGEAAMKTKKYRYIIHVPVQEIWVYEVEANSEKEALASWIHGVQIYSLAGSTKSRNAEVVERHLTNYHETNYKPFVNNKQRK